MLLNLAANVYVLLNISF